MVIGRHEMGGEFGGKVGKDDANKKNTTTSVKRKQSPADLNNKKNQTKENEHVRTLSKQPKKKENIQNSRMTLYPFTVNLMPGNDQ